VNKHRITLLVSGLLVIAALAATGKFPQHGDHYGFWSVLPPAVAIILAFVTRDVITSLFLGIALGGVISGKLNIVQEYLIPSIGSEAYAIILLVYLWALGGLIGLWTRTGGAQTFAEWAGSKIVVGPRTAKFFAWFMGRQQDRRGPAHGEVLRLVHGHRIPPGRNHQHGPHGHHRAAGVRQAPRIP
jgi:hypothetical protein